MNLEYVVEVASGVLVDGVFGMDPEDVVEIVSGIFVEGVFSTSDSKVYLPIWLISPFKLSLVATFKNGLH
jgi:hypothetical protein